MPAPEPSQQRGIVLLVVLLTVALLTMTVMEFTFATQVDYRRAGHWIEAQRALLAAQSGVDLGVEVLEQADIIYRYVFGQEKAADSLAELWAQLCSPADADSCPGKFGPICAIDTGGGKLAIRITDEAGLYNLNRLAKAGLPSAERERKVFARIALTAGIDPDLIGAIADWVDENDRPFAFAPGAESGLYASLSRNYAPRNGPLATFGELALIEGITPDSLVRLRSIGTAVDPAGGTTINVNTASLRLLGALDPELGPILPALAEERCVKPFESIEDLRKRLPDWPRWLGDRWIRFRSDWFRIRATGLSGEARQSVEALVHREDDSIRVMYYLSRRGILIPQIAAEAQTTIDDLRSRAQSSEIEQF